MPQRPPSLAERLRSTWRRRSGQALVTAGALDDRPLDRPIDQAVDQGPDRAHDFADRLRAAVTTSH